MTTITSPTADRRLVLNRRVRLFVAATITYNVIEAVVAITADAEREQRPPAFRWTEQQS